VVVGGIGVDEVDVDVVVTVVDGVVDCVDVDGVGVGVDSVEVDGVEVGLFKVSSLPLAGGVWGLAVHVESDALIVMLSSVSAGGGSASRGFGVSAIGEAGLSGESVFGLSTVGETGLSSGSRFG
jgi:hypothetical protein